MCESNIKLYLAHIDTAKIFFTRAQDVVEDVERAADVEYLTSESRETNSRIQFGDPCKSHPGPSNSSNRPPCRGGMEKRFTM